MEDFLLVPLRWMAWESVIEVSMFNIWSFIIAFPILKGGICLSPASIPPSNTDYCFAFQRRYTTKSDCYSFGVCLWEILNFAGQRPHQELSDSALLETLHTQTCPQLPCPANCNRDLYELMLECCNSNENLRPSFREIHLFLQRKNLGYSPV